MGGGFLSLTPGLVIEACIKDDRHIKKRYAKKMGIAGETLEESQGAL